MKTRIWKYSDIQEMKKVIGNQHIVLVGGCFDLLHYGHFSFLNNAKAQGDVLVVALESDRFVKASKKRDPVHSSAQRAEILVSLHMVDHVVLLPFFSTDEEYSELVKSVEPTVIAVTEGDPNIEHKKQHANIVNAEVKVVSSLLPQFSTTQIIANENIYRS